ncbi:MAG: hypothetical protein DRI90_28025 [Deltaproteobacteria bacterium]|nr:MAG: hypothetical protein DRI90_28025 [Deltaproteobacteria bacterium]
MGAGLAVVALGVLNDSEPVLTLGVLVCLASLVATVVLSMKRAQHGQLEADEKGIRIDGKLIASPGRRTWGTVLPKRYLHYPRTFILNRSGAVVQILDLGVDEGRELLKAARLDRDHVAAEMLYHAGQAGEREASLGFVGMVLFAANLGAGTILVLKGLSTPEGRLAAYGLAATWLVINPLVWLAYRALNMRLRWGHDGIWMKRLFRTRFVHTTEVEALRQWPRWGGQRSDRHPPQGLDIVLRGGETIRLATQYASSRFGYPTDDIMFKELNELRGLQPAPQAVAALDRNGRSPEQWLDALRDLSGSKSDYRSGVINVEKLVEICENPAATAAQRGASAALLMSEGSDDERNRLLRQAGATVYAPLGAVLLAAAQGDEPGLLRALATLPD